MISRGDWRWFGHSGHLIVGQDCRFHLCTVVGAYVVSTVGEWLPDAPVREIFAESRGITLEGRGDARRRDYLAKVGYETVGLDRKYETMVFHAGPACEAADCNCGMPVPKDWSNLDMMGYNDAGAATRGHEAMCVTWAEKQEKT